jgi:hypothetical protein
MIEPVHEAGESRISSGDLVSMLLGGVVFAVVAGSGLLNILAALKIWNPLHWEGRFWTGVFMILAPTAIALMAGLPYRVRQKIPEGAAGVAILALWIAFFWAACGGH